MIFMYQWYIHQNPLGEVEHGLIQEGFTYKGIISK